MLFVNHLSIMVVTTDRCYEGSALRSAPRPFHPSHGTRVGLGGVDRVGFGGVWQGENGTVEIRTTVVCVKAYDPSVAIIQLSESDEIRRTSYTTP